MKNCKNALQSTEIKFQYWIIIPPWIDLGKTSELMENYKSNLKMSALAKFRQWAITNH